MAAGLGGVIGVAGGKLLGRPSGAAPELASQIDTLENQQRETGLQLAKIGRDQQELETSLKAEMKALVSGTGNGESLKALVAELDAVSTRLDEALASGNPEAVAALTQRVEALEAVDTSGAASPQDLARAMAGVEARLGRAEQVVQDLRAAGTGVDEARFTQLESSIVSLRSDLQAAQLASNQDADELTSLLSQMRSGEAEAREEAAAATGNAQIALALSAIESASRQGREFESEYRTLRTLLPREDAVRELAPISAAGAPTLADLQERFATDSAAARKAIADGNGKGLSWLNRVFGDAVTVRRTDGEVSEPAVLLSDAGAAMAAGDVSAAVASVDQLDGAPAAAMADWTRLAKQRITLETTLETLRLGLTEGGQ